MFRNRVIKVAIGVLLTGSIITCTMFFSEGLTEQSVPAVTLTNLTEIKELPRLDNYGFVADDSEIREGRVRKNESLYIILANLDVDASTIYEIEKESRDIFDAKRLRPGQKYLTYHDSETGLSNRLIFHTNTRNYIVFEWGDEIKVTKGVKPVVKKVTETSGVITSSLYETILENGDHPQLGNRLSEIFGWQIDFFRLQKNDYYRLIYEQEYVDEKPYGVGRIIAAQFTHKGETFDAYFYETEDRAGYFDSNGNGVQKALLKAPFRYSQRVSSNFSHSRFHPVLKRRMPHYGVDYAAPLGTPVISVGDGEVIEARYRGPNGNIVKIRHNSTYTTAYLHLNGFARGIKRGVRVKQGDVIGYVGKTGRVTGVHLDYRIYKNEHPVNPLKVKLPPSKAIADEKLADFKMHVNKYRFQLEQIENELLASEM